MVSLHLSTKPGPLGRSIALELRLFELMVKRNFRTASQPAMKDVTPDKRIILKFLNNFPAV